MADLCPALGYETSPTTGDADCSWHGIVYPYNNSAPYPVPRRTNSSASGRPRPSSSSPWYSNATTVGRVGGPTTATPLPAGTGSVYGTGSVAVAGTGTIRGTAGPSAGPAATGGPSGNSSGGSSSAPFPTSSAAGADGATTPSSGPSPTTAPTPFEGSAARPVRAVRSLLALAAVFFALG